MPNRVFVPPPHALDRNLALEVVRVTEASALAASRWIGRGDEKAADEAATEAMRQALNSLSMDGRLVNGSGAITLSNGDKVGTGTGPKVDIVLTPIEGATICAKGSHNAISVVAATQEGSFLHVPADAYMEKLAVGPGLPQGVIDLSVTPRTICSTSPPPRAWRSPTSPSACWTARATPICWAASTRPVRAWC